MPQQLLFHEKCTADVHEIINRIVQNEHAPKTQKNAFLSRLTEAYQLIFENPHTSSSHIFEHEIPWNQRIDKKIVKIFDFPYLIVYTVLSSGTPVVLGIISSVTNILSAK